MFEEKIKTIKENKEIAAYYTNDSHTDKFLVGYLIEFNDDYFILAHISPQGTYDGFLLKEINSIYRVETKNLYLNKILTLAKYYNTTHEKIDFENKNLVLEFLLFAKKQNYVVSLELLNSNNLDSVGYIERLEKDYCEIKQLDDYGQLDGFSLIYYSDIVDIRCNTEDEIILKILDSNK